MNITNCKFLRFFRINAIVIYPFVLYQDRHPCEAITSHEKIHLRQIKDLGVIKFYYLYLKEYLIGRKRGLSHYEAYRQISFEREAYEKQTRAT